MASAIYFAMATAIVNSYGLGIQEYRFGNLYFTQDGGLIQVFETLLANPGYAISQIIRNTNDNSMDKIGYIISMLVPVAAVLFTTGKKYSRYILPVSYTHLRAHETRHDLVCRLLLEKKKNNKEYLINTPPINTPQTHLLSLFLL